MRTVDSLRNGRLSWLWRTGVAADQVFSSCPKRKANRGWVPAIFPKLLDIQVTPWHPETAIEMDNSKGGRGLGQGCPRCKSLIESSHRDRSLSQTPLSGGFAGPILLCLFSGLSVLWRLSKSFPKVSPMKITQSQPLTFDLSVTRMKVRLALFHREPCLQNGCANTLRSLKHISSFSEDVSREVLDAPTRFNRNRPKKPSLPLAQILPLFVGPWSICLKLKGTPKEIN